MNKFSTALGLVSLVPALLLAGAPLAQAQVYTTSYGTPVYSTPISNVSGCIALTAPMTVGASDYLNGGQVSELQTFLVRDNMLSSAYITGYYGNLTASAVAQFQASRGISPTGVVGPLTRAAIQQVSCGSTGINYISPAQPINPGGPEIPYNPYNGGSYNTYIGAPYLNSLSSTGTTVTLQGYAFDPSYNTVHFGTYTVGSVASTNGTQLTFTVPSVPTGSYEIYISDSRGSSNSLPYSVQNSSYNNCGYTNTSYAYNSNCNCVTPTVYNGSNYSYNYSYGSNCTNNYGSPSISALSPNAGAVGTQIQIQGSGFSQNGNTVYFGNGGSTNVQSYNGNTIYFTIPSIISPVCPIAGTVCPTYAQQVTPGSYPIYVTNQNGQSSNTLNFQVYNY